jgi:site-specific DNA recombinase
MKAIIVSRVSTEEQKENSPEAQLYRMETYCKNREFDILRTFNIVESAYKTKRDDFDEVLELIENTKEKIAVCFDKVDRLSRNIFDKRVALLYEKAINNQIELHFVSDNQVINDKMNAGDKFAFGMKLGLSKYYSDAISDNVKRTFELKRRKGEWTGPVRLGYLNVPLDVENRTRKDIIIDPDRGHLITKMFELYASGNYSLEAIRMKVTDMGLRSLKGNKLSKSMVENIVKDSFYCGIAISHKYGPYPHNYPRLVSKDLYDRCQEIRKKRKIAPSKVMARQFLFGGLLKCQNCGCSISFEFKKKPSGKEYVIGACTNSKKICEKIYVNENDLIKPVYDILERFERITPEVQEELVAELRKNTEAEAVYHQAQVVRIRKDYDALIQKKDRLLNAYLDQSITKAVYDKKHQELQDEIQKLELEMQEHSKADFDYQTTVATVISVARRAKSIFENSSDVAGKRAFLNYVLQNPTVDGAPRCE